MKKTILVFMVAVMTLSCVAPREANATDTKSKALVFGGTALSVTTVVCMAGALGISIASIMNGMNEFRAGVAADAAADAASESRDLKNIAKVCGVGAAIGVVFGIGTTIVVDKTMATQGDLDASLKKNSAVSQAKKSKDSIAHANTLSHDLVAKSASAY